MESYDEETHVWIRNPWCASIFQTSFYPLTEQAKHHPRLWRPDILWLLSVLQAVHFEIWLEKKRNIHPWLHWSSVPIIKPRRKKNVMFQPRTTVVCVNFGETHAASHRWFSLRNSFCGLESRPIAGRNLCKTARDIRHLSYGCPYAKIPAIRSIPHLTVSDDVFLSRTRHRLTKRFYMNLEQGLWHIHESLPAMRSLAASHYHHQGLAKRCSQSYHQTERGVQSNGLANRRGFRRHLRRVFENWGRWILKDQSGVCYNVWISV